MPPYKIAMIGCGNLGTAMARRWLDTPDIQSILIIKPSPPSLSAPKIEYSADISAIHERLDAVILAVKPQIIEDVCKGLAPHLTPDMPVISIAAGTSVKTLSSHFSSGQAIIRTMPNTPSAIGKGMISLLKTSALTNDHMTLAENLFKPLGQTMILENEDDMHSAGAITASGPAFLFYYVEAVMKAARDLGYSEEQARLLARQTVIGAAGLIEDKEETSVADLRAAVTSKGGMTKAGLDILMDGRLDSIIKETLDAAIKRSRELGKAK